MAEDLRTPDEWADEYHVRIMDPDGWRLDGKNFKTPITENEFLWRVSESTVMHEM